MSTRTEQARQERIDVLDAAIQSGDFATALEKAEIGSSQLAEKLEVEKAVVSKIVTGKRRPSVRSDVADALAKWYQGRVRAAKRSKK